MFEDECVGGQAYLVHLEIFDGPLDLLLRLIEREEMDITQVSLSRVTGQFLAHLEGLEQTRVEDLAEFLVVAARLILIKSRALLPVPPSPDGEEGEDPGEDLVARLKEYRRFKVAAEALRAWENLGLHSFARLAPAPMPEARLPPGSGQIRDLLEAMLDALRQHAPDSAVDGVVSPITVTLDQRIDFIASLVATKSRSTFHELLRSCRSRAEIVVTFLAILELVRLLRVHIRQETLFGEIVLEAIPTRGDAGDENQREVGSHVEA